MIYRLISFALCFILFLPSSFLIPSSAIAQQRNFGVRLLEGQVAPFSGLLIDADAATQCIEDSAAVPRLTTELAVAQRVQEQSSILYEQHIREQESRILQLSTTSWWEENGNIIMLTLGLILGVVGAAVVVGLAN